MQQHSCCMKKKALNLFGDFGARCRRLQDGLSALPGSLSWTWWPAEVPLHLNYFMVLEGSLCCSGLLSEQIHLTAPAENEGKYLRICAVSSEGLVKVQTAGKEWLGDGRCWWKKKKKKERRLWDRAFISISCQPSSALPLCWPALGLAVSNSPVLCRMDGHGPWAVVLRAEILLSSGSAPWQVQVVICILHFTCTLSISLDRRMESSWTMLEHLGALWQHFRHDVTQEMISQSCRSSAAMNIFLVLSSL